MSLVKHVTPVQEQAMREKALELFQSETVKIYIPEKRDDFVAMLLSGYEYHGVKGEDVPREYRLWIATRANPDNPKRFEVRPNGDKWGVWDNKTGKWEFNLGVYGRRDFNDWSKDLADDWCEVWNAVEHEGKCGNCLKVIGHMPGYQSGFHTNTFGHGMYHRMCFECSCAQDD